MQLNCITKLLYNLSFHIPRTYKSSPIFVLISEYQVNFQCFNYYFLFKHITIMNRQLNRHIDILYYKTPFITQHSNITDLHNVLSCVYQDIHKIFMQLKSRNISDALLHNNYDIYKHNFSLQEVGTIHLNCTFN